MIAGLALLKDSGEIDLVVTPAGQRYGARSHHVRMRVLDRATGTSTSAHLDLQDGFALDGGTGRDSADVIFKRTLVRSLMEPPSEARLLPYGLLFECRSGHEGLLLAHSMRSVQGLLPPRSEVDLKLIAWSLRTNARLLARRWWRSKYLPVSLAEYEVSPERPADDLILYQTRVWDPGSGSDPADRQSANEARAETVRALRRSFRDRFVGGLIPSPYAVATYPDCLSPVATARASYLQLVHRCSIVISTTGLYGSVPFKVPEYMAASRAIVTEPINVELPRPLEDEHHVATFTTPEDCVERCERLLTDPGYLAHLRHSAAEYYRTEVRPEALLRNRLDDLRRL